MTQASALLTDLQNLDATWPRGRYVRSSEIASWSKAARIPCSLADARVLAISLDAEDARLLEALALRFNRSQAAIEGQNSKWLLEQLDVHREQFDAQGLTENQRRAILIDADVTLVVAGAGTGKSTTIVHKIDHLVRSGLARPQEILVLAYNKEAQLHLQQRIEALEFGNEVRARTFHAFGYGVISQSRPIRPDAISDGETFQLVLSVLHRWRRSTDRPGNLADAMRTLAPDFATPEKTQAFASLMSSMVARVKTRRLSFEDLSNRASTTRQRAFLTVLGAFTELYDAHLRDRNAIDFSDMIVLATDAVASGSSANRFRYILIDEFQDIAPARWRLVSALRQTNPGAALFLVGDDWQSIYAFDDADVSIMTELPKRERGVVRIDLDTTFRFGLRTATVSSRFVMENPGQLRKTITSASSAGDGAIVIHQDGAAQKDARIRRIIAEIADKRPDVRSLLILGRYNKGRPDSFFELLAEGRARGIQVTYSTCHSAKGLEADEVVIVDVLSGMTGFPSKMRDDDIMDLAPTRPDPFLDGEERRLFYVALTRSRGYVHLLSDEKRRSSFIEELLPASGTTTPVPTKKVRAPRPGVKAASIPVVEVFGRLPHCASCHEPTMIRRDSKNGPFWGCRSFPACWGKPKKCPHCGAMAWMMDAPHGQRFCGECGEP